MKNFPFLLLIVYLSLSAQEKDRPESAFEKNSSSPSVKNRPGKTVPSRETLYREFPTDAKKGIQIVSEEDQKIWSSSKRVALIVGVSAYPLGSGLSRLNFGASDSQIGRRCVHSLHRAGNVRRGAEQGRRIRHIQ